MKPCVSCVCERVCYFYCQNGCELVFIKTQTGFLGHFRRKMYNFVRHSHAYVVSCRLMLFIVENQQVLSINSSLLGRPREKG